MVKPYSKPATDEPAWWFVLSADQVLVTATGEPPFGPLGQLKFPELDDYTVLHIGSLRERRCYLVIADYLDDSFIEGEFTSLRSIFTAGDMELFAMAGRARQYADFINTHRFCGRCGARMQYVDWEIAAHCQHCQHRCYPRISPCIIVAITKGDRILLAQGKRHKEGVYSVLAGFVEAGETLEQTLHREVHEEAGIKVKNLQYQFNQPWPFPHSLMMGFTAEWESGDLHIDPYELVTGDWFAFDQLPTIPPAGTIAYQLIQLAIGKAQQ